MNIEQLQTETVLLKMLLDRNQIILQMAAQIKSLQEQSEPEEE